MKAEYFKQCNAFFFVELEKFISQSRYQALELYLRQLRPTKCPEEGSIDLVRNRNLQMFFEFMRKKFNKTDDRMTTIAELFRYQMLHPHFKSNQENLDYHLRLLRDFTDKKLFHLTTEEICGLMCLRNMQGDLITDFFRRIESLNEMAQYAPATSGTPQHDLS